MWELQLSAVQEDNGGLYVCLAHSHMGLYSDAISLELDVYGRKENSISSDEIILDYMYMYVYVYYVFNDEDV